MIRRATLDDLDFLIDLAASVYGDFNEQNARLWICKTLEVPAAVIFRGEAGAVVATVNAPFYRPAEIRAFIVFIACQDPRLREGVRLCREVVNWGRTMGAQSLRFGSQTDCDLAPLAKRLGAKTESPSFVLEL